MRHLEDCLREANFGHSRVVLISGEPGIGKSRLLADFAERCRRRNPVLLGVGQLAEGSVPFHPVVEAFRSGFATIPLSLPPIWRAEVARILPEPPAAVLDVGAGPGIYAAWLARLGYAVHLIDPLPLHLEQARQASQEQPEHPIASISLGDARNLPQPDQSIDVVLLFGPLYHLTERSERIAALREARRVLRPGGYAFAVGISRFASTLDGLLSGYLDDPDFVRIAQQDLKDGQHRNPTQIAHYFTSAFFHHPYELREEVEAAGLRLDKLLAIEGIAVFVRDLEQRWADARRREQLLQAVRWLEDDPTVLGITGHLMAVASRQK